PLAAGNLVLDDSVARCDTGTPLLNTAEALKQRLFEQLLGRNQKSHGRPGKDNTAYLTLLQQAAALPWTHNRVLDAHGYFIVSETDRVAFTDDHGQGHEVYARDVLNRSGLVTVDVTESREARYRFEPVWVQSFLVDKRQYPSVPLFNGKDLSGWAPVGTPDAFTVKENAIQTTGAGPYPSWPRTDKAYENFILKVEYQSQGWYEGGVCSMHRCMGRPPGWGSRCT
ncbi:MAG: DUF1080 domain-containing protein, partial [Planctomycetes bacterium]|nr:DUF1080 domain-containing protein [Planctomycetota bacterium]